MKLPSVFLMTNEPFPGQQESRVDGYRELVRRGDLAGVERLSMYKPGKMSRDEFLLEYERRLRNSPATHVVIWNPPGFVGDREAFERLRDAIGDRVLVYWEGDPWGSGIRCGVPWIRGKIHTREQRWWLQSSDTVFSVAGAPQVDILLERGARTVYRTFQTYPHLDVAEAEEDALPVPRATVGCVQIGSNLAKLPGLTGLPGSAGRFELVWRIRRVLGDDFRLFGAGWPPGWSQGVLPFDRQFATICDAGVSVNWDHFPRHHGYSSDRLPIAMVTGIPHVTTLHPGMEWHPGASAGVFQVRSPKAGAEVAARIARGFMPEAAVAAQEGRRWVLHRLSDREAARHIMSTLIDEIDAPPADPWATLPGPVTAPTEDRYRT